MSERDSSEFETSEFVKTETDVNRNKNTRHGFWQGCHSWTNPGFQQIQFQPENKSRLWGQIVCTVQLAAATKTVNLSFGKQLQIQLSTNFIFDQSMLWLRSEATAREICLVQKMSRNFSIFRQIFYSFTVFKGRFSHRKLHWDESNRLVQPRFSVCF